ncbi:putative protein T-ENOL isoform X2 [Molossus molossus]|uniref:Uncharacterized protein n=1 Tax=Molossus molossus TaxID=27622 RepID=A0A7J8J0V8_MOLMO|nr:putative protein T-ENOL isoform X2 [Molossus molossus]KAF6490039.1 hypothetical protein HJG59_010409 [Molossus molossus]
MESTHTRNKEKKGSRLSQAATSLSGSSKASLSRSEEFLARISTELTDEALFIAGYHMSPVPTKEKQTQEQGTQLSKHELVTKTQGTDTCSDKNCTCTKAYLLPSPHDKYCSRSWNMEASQVECLPSRHLNGGALCPAA